VGCGNETRPGAPASQGREFGKGEGAQPKYHAPKQPQPTPQQPSNAKTPAGFHSRGRLSQKEELPWIGNAKPYHFFGGGGRSGGRPEKSLASHRGGLVARVRRPWARFPRWGGGVVAFEEEPLYGLLSQTSVIHNLGVGSAYSEAARDAMQVCGKVVKMVLGRNISP